MSRARGRSASGPRRSAREARRSGCGLAEREVRLDPVEHRRRPQFLQPGGGGGGEPLVRHVGEGGAAPGRQRLAEQVRGGPRVAVGECAAARPGPASKATASTASGGTVSRYPAGDDSIAPSPGPPGAARRAAGTPGTAGRWRRPLGARPATAGRSASAGTSGRRRGRAGSAARAPAGRRSGPAAVVVAHLERAEHADPHRFRRANVGRLLFPSPFPPSR